jgi:hypothetical protein
MRVFRFQLILILMLEEIERYLKLYTTQTGGMYYDPEDAPKLIPTVIIASRS